MKRIVLKSRPEKSPTLDNFQLEEAKELTISGDNQILCRTLYLSVDPYLKGKLDGTAEYVKHFKLNQTLASGGIGQVLESTSSNFKKGELVYSFLYPWQSFALFQGEELKELRNVTHLEHPSYALSSLGMPGMTAYFGFTDICKPKKGDTLLVTGAAGAVGSMVGQIGKILGCRVVGITGSEEKVKEIKELGFDIGLNYKKEDNLAEAIKRVCPQGIDCFFDNVGGPIMDAVFENLKVGARVALCGAISQYGGDNQIGKRVNWIILQRGILVKGFVVFREYGNRIEEGMKAMEEWMNAGKLKMKESVEYGIENAPRALLNLFEGKNVGKQIVSLVETPTSH